MAYCNATSSAAAGRRLPRLRRHLRLRPRAARPVLGLPRRVGLRRRQDRQLRGDGAHLRRLRRARRGSARSPSPPSSALTAVNYLGVRKTAVLTRVIVAVVLAALALVVAGAAFGGHGERRPPRRPRRRRRRRDPAVGRAAVLRVRRLRPHRHPRRGGRRPRPHDPEGHPPGARRSRSSSTPSSPSARSPPSGPTRSPARTRRSPPPCAPATSTRSCPPCASAAPSPRSASCSRSSPASAAPRSPWPPIGELPGWLDAVHPDPQGPPPRRARRRRARRRCSSSLTDLRGAIGFSSFCVLTYYAIANAAAWTLPPEQRRWPRALAAAGVVGCATLAFTLPVASVVDRRRRPRRRRVGPGRAPPGAQSPSSSWRACSMSCFSWVSRASMPSNLRSLRRKWANSTRARSP